MIDQELIALFLARSEEAVPALAAQYGPYCRAVAAQLLADPRDVDECLNDVWLSVWRAIPPTRPEHFKGWLAAIVRNRALAMGRENGRRPPTVDEAALELASCLPPSPDPAGESEYRALTEAVERFLRAQPRTSVLFSCAATGTPTRWRTPPAAWAGASAKPKACCSAPGTGCAHNCKRRVSCEKRTGLAPYGRH